MEAKNAFVLFTILKTLAIEKIKYLEQLNLKTSSENRHNSLGSF